MIGEKANRDDRALHGVTLTRSILTFAIAWVCGGGWALAAPLVVSNADIDLDLSAPPVNTDGVDVGGGPNFGGTLSAINGSFVNNPNWTNTGNLNVGVLAFVDPSGPGLTVGELELTPGTFLVNTGAAVIGRGFNKQGIVTVDEGAVWVNAGQLQVGAGGGGTGHQLNVYGAATASDSASVGVGDGTSAGATIRGTDAIWNVLGGFGTLDIGGSGGSGQMHILDGGMVNSSFGFVGTSAGFFPGAHGQGQVEITSTDPLSDDSFWNVDNYISVGEFTGVGSLTVGDRGHANAGRMFVGMGDGTGTVIVNTGGRVELQSTVNTWDGSTIDLTGGGRMLMGLGFIDFVPDGTMRIGLGGALLGDGLIKGDVEVFGGTIKPGHSPGKLTIEGNLTLDGDGILDIEIGGVGAGEFDQLEVLGGTVLDGTLNLIFLPGFSPSAGESFSLDLFPNGGISGGITGLTVQGLAPDLVLDVDLSQLANGQPLDVNVVAVPEPSTLVLLSLFALNTARSRRRA